MKSVILTLTVVLLSVVSANSQQTQQGGQSLKDLLYGGKLKMDSGTVIRKTDDLASKIDTSTKKPPAEPEKPKVATVVKDSAGVLTTTTTSVDPAATSVTDPTEDPTATTAAPKDNNRLWKDYIDELTGTLRTEVMTSKKIKNGSYSVLIDYEIGADGNITVNSVSSVPESSFLEQQIKERLTLTAPQMTPLLGTNGKPRKAVKKQTITLSK